MRRSARVSAAATLLGFASCSLWISSEPEQIGCTAEGKLGPPACATGFICVHQACQRCVAKESCGDGIDNDCNGRVDDGCTNVGLGGAEARGGSAGQAAALQGSAGTAKPAQRGGAG